MKFIDSIKDCYFNYLNFNGVASRSEYWYFALYSFLTINVAFLGFYLDGRFGPSLIGVTCQTIAVALYFSTIIPSLAVTLRRLHDIGLSGWVMLIIIIPLFGSVLFLAMMCKSHKDSKYSSDMQTSIASNRKKYISAILVVLLSLLGSAGALRSLDVYVDYEIAKGLEKLSPYEREVLTYQFKIDSGIILRAAMQTTLIPSPESAKSLKVNSGKTQLPKQISDLLEANEFWWVEKNRLTIIIGNYQSEAVSNVVFSLQKGDCDVPAKEITYLNLDFGHRLLQANSRIAYVSDLPFNYKEKFGGELICGLVISAMGR